jgi:hypothetical protein
LPAMGKLRHSRASGNPCLPHLGGAKLDARFRGHDENVLEHNDSC